VADLACVALGAFLKPAAVRRGRAALPIGLDAEENLSFFRTLQRLMKPHPAVPRSSSAAASAGVMFLNPHNTEERPMRKIEQPVARKPAKKIADARRVRYGSGNAPRVVRAADAAVQDPRRIRFGSGNCPASLRK